MERKLLLAADQDPKTKPDPTLIRLLAQAHCWFEDLKTGKARSNRDLMAQSGVDHAEVAGVLPLALPAPEMVAAILAGSQPLGLTASRLMQMSDLPLSWAEQRRVLGFS